MSEQDYDQGNLRDKYDQQPRGDFAPVVSWKKSDVGDSVLGILLPDDPIKRPDRGYGVRPEYKQANPKEGQEAGYTYWPPKNNPEKINRPVVESEFVTRWPNVDISKARQVEQYHYTLQTNLMDGTLLSSKYKERCAEAEPPKDPNVETRRRIIEQGESLTKAVAGALKKVGGKPIPGQTWKITLSGKTPNDYGGDTNSFTVEITAPTAETREIVKAYVAAKQQEANEAKDAENENDRYAQPLVSVGASSEEPPPF